MSTFLVSRYRLLWSLAGITMGIRRVMVTPSLRRRSILSGLLESSAWTA